MRIERNTYQTKKFDYQDEAENKTKEEWIRQFENYINRIQIFGLDESQGFQATLKLAATALALCEHLVDKQEFIPMPGCTSGEIVNWDQIHHA